MTQQLPPGQGPIDPRPAFNPPPPPGGAPHFSGGYGPPPQGPWSPPPGGMMPMPMGGYPPPPPRRGRGRRILFVLLLIAFGISVMLNLVLIGGGLSGLGGDGPTVRQTTVIDGSITDKVAVIPVTGVIDDAVAKRFDGFLTHAEKDSSVKAIVLEIDTPGGSATASDEMYHRVTVLKQRMKDAGRNVPVVVAQKGMATSGGYYVSCAGDYVFAEPGTWTGNIGVLLPMYNLSKLADKYGIEETTITDASGVYKNAGSMLKAPSEQDRAYLQGLVEAAFGQFKNVVTSGRAGKLKDDENDIFSGKAFAAAEALKRGLVDKVDYPEAAYDYAASQAGISNKTVVRYEEPPSLFKLLSSRSGLGGGGGATLSGGGSGVRVDGVAIDARTIQDLVSPRPLYLWRGN